MEKTIRKVVSSEEAENEEYRYWQSVPAAERIAAAWRLSIDQYRRKGIEPDGQGRKRSLVRTRRP
jgi:hypothetical protein